jgi:quercetin dioxygenase-like cupin family protein
MKNSFLTLCLIPLFACVSTEQTKNEIKVVEVVKSSHSWNGTKLPLYSQGQPEVTVLRITIPKGVTLPMHQHPVINVGVLLKGELTVKTQKGETLLMKAGDPIVEVVDTWHLGTSTGKEDAEIMVFYAGVKDTPLTIKR